MSASRRDKGWTDDDQVCVFSSSDRFAERARLLRRYHIDNLRRTVASS